MKKNKFKIYTLGCKVNQYDSAKLASELMAQGFQVVEREGDLAIINTCAVTKSAIQKVKRIIAVARKENPRAKIVIAGCWPKVYEKDCQGLEAEIISGRPEAKKIISLFSLKNNWKAKRREVVFDPRRARYFIKIQDGCEQFCSYCIIPHTRGKLTSRKELEVLGEIREAVKVGYQEIVLCGIHLGLYGRENGQGSLVDILQKIIKIKELGRVRLSSIEITEISDELISLMKKNKKICPHLHIPLQSGGDKILKLMNRPYDTAYFLKRLKKIRQAIPGIAITTDVIIGFPGETDTDFKKTCSFVKKAGFSRLHVFSFSAHEKTPAASMSKQVNQKEMARRSQELRKIGEKLKKDYEKDFIGKTLEVVVEYIFSDGMARGTSENYLDIKFKYNSHLKTLGKIIKLNFN